MKEYTILFPINAEAIDASIDAISKGKRVEFYADAKGYFARFYVTFIDQ